MRTDTQRLDFLLQVMEQQDEAAAERIQGAFMLNLKGRIALDAAMGAKIVEPGEPMPELTAIDLATAEVGRIRNVKGFSEVDDDRYDNHDLADAAISYIDASGCIDKTDGVPDSWPWAYPFKPSPNDRKKELTKGIALALCELDRVIRAERRGPVTVGIDLARGPDQCVVDGILQAPYVRKSEVFGVGSRVTLPGVEGTQTVVKRHTEDLDEAEYELEPSGLRVQGWHLLEAPRD
jgi:hypothetical protein